MMTFQFASVPCIQSAKGDGRPGRPALPSSGLARPRCLRAWRHLETQQDTSGFEYGGDVLSSKLKAWSSLALSIFVLSLFHPISSSHRIRMYAIY